MTKWFEISCLYVVVIFLENSTANKFDLILRLGKRHTQTLHMRTHTHTHDLVEFHLGWISMEIS